MRSSLIIKTKQTIVYQCHIAQKQECSGIGSSFASVREEKDNNYIEGFSGLKEGGIRGRGARSHRPHSHSKDIKYNLIRDVYMHCDRCNKKLILTCRFTLSITQPLVILNTEKAGDSVVGAGGRALPGESVASGLEFDIFST